MTDSERYLRGWGISLLVHGVLAGVALWLWSRPPQKPKPEPSRWEVSLLDAPRTAPEAPAIEDRLPPPPDVASEPPDAALTQPSTPAAPPTPGAASAAAPAFDLPKLALPTNSGTIGAIAVPVTGTSGGSMGLPMAGAGAGSGGQPLPAPGFGAGGAGLSPIARIPPTYPMEARRQKIEGWARVEFTVREDGSVGDIEVKGAQPAGVFDQAAMAAIAQWKFRPALENGKPARKRAAQTLKFELNR
jgi:protein TonB